MSKSCTTITKCSEPLPRYFDTLISLSERSKTSNDKYAKRILDITLKRLVVDYQNIIRRINLCKEIVVDVYYQKELERMTDELSSKFGSTPTELIPNYDEL